MKLAGQIVLIVVLAVSLAVLANPRGMIDLYEQATGWPV